MNTFETTIQNRRIELDAPDDLPDGTKVIVDVMPSPSEKIGIADSEWRDDSEALADWKAWLKTIEPIEWIEFDHFDQVFRQFNIEAVRKQMQEGIS
jgi:hypothetical protein